MFEFCIIPRQIFAFFAIGNEDWLTSYILLLSSFLFFTLLICHIIYCLFFLSTFLYSLLQSCHHFYCLFLFFLFYFLSSLLFSSLFSRTHLQVSYVTMYNSPTPHATFPSPSPHRNSAGRSSMGYLDSVQEPLQRIASASGEKHAVKNRNWNRQFRQYF